MTILDHINKILFKRLGLTLVIEGVHLHLSSFEFDEIGINKHEKRLLTIHKLRILPKWNLLLQVAGRFVFERLEWGNLELTEGSGDFHYKKKHLQTDSFGTWQGKIVRLSVLANFPKTQQQDEATTVEVSLSSKEYSPQIPLGNSSDLVLQAPFKMELQVELPRNYFNTRDFDQLAWTANLQSEQLLIDVITFPDFKLVSQKKKGEKGYIRPDGAYAESLSGELIIEKAGLMHMSGQLKSVQPIISRLLEKHLEIRDIDEEVAIVLDIRGKGKSLGQLFRNLEMYGAYQVNPLSINQIHYDTFHGSLSINTEELQVTIKEIPLNGGVADLHFHQVFEGESQLRLTFSEVESYPIFQILDMPYGVRGPVRGWLRYGNQSPDEPYILELNLEFTDGELVGKNNLVERFVVWKELNEVRRQLLSLNGFRQLIVQMEYDESIYNIKNMILNGNLQQVVRLSGTIQQTERLDLVLETSFAQLTPFIVNIRGPVNSPLILPAPKLMAEKLVKNSQKFLKDFLGGIKDLR